MSQRELIELLNAEVEQLRGQRNLMTSAIRSFLSWWDDETENVGLEALIERLRLAVKND